MLSSCLGMSNQEIAEKYKYTTIHVANILNTPQAALTRGHVLELLRAKTESTYEDKMRDIEDKAIRKVQRLMDDEQAYLDNPVGVAKTAIVVLQGVGRLADNRGAADKKGMTPVYVSKELAEILQAGFAKAKEAKRLNAPASEILTTEFQPTAEVVTSG